MDVPAALIHLIIAGVSVLAGTVASWAVVVLKAREVKRRTGEGGRILNTLALSFDERRRELSKQHTTDAPIGCPPHHSI